MTVYEFCKRYNLAYDFFLMRYFKDAGIQIDENTSFAEVAPREALARDMTERTPHEELFVDYISRWREHPEARPAFKELFARTIDARLSLEQLSNLEKEFPNEGKLLFSAQEVAAAISDFYRKYMRIPLKNKLEEGASGAELDREFFSSTDHNKLPDSRFVGVEEMEAEINRVAGELLTWLKAIRLEMIEADMKHVLTEHEETPGHMKLFPDMGGKGEHWSCTHTSEYVELICYRDIKEDHESVILQPSKGFLISDYLIGLGWDYVIFPQFYAMMRKQKSSEVHSDLSLKPG